jgi:hypothetical protein
MRNITKPPLEQPLKVTLVNFTLGKSHFLGFIQKIESL